MELSLKRKLEIALCNYLPYDVEIQFTDEDGKIWYKTLAVYPSEMNNKLGISSVMMHENYKLVLHPLSDLTKEIEHNGEKINCWDILDSEADINTYKDCLTSEGLPYAPHILVEYLFEWHFDVFGLIEVGLAIDKNTIKDGIKSR